MDKNNSFWYWVFSNLINVFKSIYASIVFIIIYCIEHYGLVFRWVGIIGFTISSIASITSYCVYGYNAYSDYYGQYVFKSWMVIYPFIFVMVFIIGLYKYWKKEYAY